MSKGNVLIVDKEENIRDLLSHLINLENYKVFEAGDDNSALKLISGEDFQVIILTDGEVIKSSSLPKDFFKEEMKKNQLSASLKMDEIEKQHILKVLHQMNDNKAKAAEALGIGLTTLYRKLQKYCGE